MGKDKEQAHLVLKVVLVNDKHNAAENAALESCLVFCQARKLLCMQCRNKHVLCDRCDRAVAVCLYHSFPIINANSLACQSGFPGLHVRKGKLACLPENSKPGHSIYMYMCVCVCV
jgi:hypothetical protein